MIIRVCDKCKSKEVIDDLKKLDVELEIRCINYCGIGRNKYVVVIDHTPIIATDKDELLNKIKEKI